MQQTMRVFLSIAIPAFICTPAMCRSLPDTTARELEQVVVTGTRRTADVIPVQELTGEQLKRLGSNTVADALRYFSGVQVKDYGGVGGIKTVNIRSMGTNHTAVVYDGVELGNAQNGQIDLGQFSLDNMEALSLYNGQKSEILQPAKDFGSAGSIYMRTRTPKFAQGETHRLRASLRTGSFDLLNPSALAELKLSKRVNASLSAEWLNSSGKYRFRYRRVLPSGETAYDTTAVRQNGDINATRIELGAYGTLPSGSWQAKAYTYNSERGIPGAIVNNVWRRGERVWDSNSFVQGRYTGYFGPFTTMAHAKYAFYRTHYVNNDDKQWQIDNLYRQREFYLSSSNQWQAAPPLRLSAAYDLAWNTLLSDMKGFERPDRLSQYLAVAAALELPRFKMQASVQGAFIHDRMHDTGRTHDRHAWSPALFANLYPLATRDLSARAFFKQSFRMPTFNDLYYADMGNSDLNPERVTQYNLGLLYERRRTDGFLAETRMSADVYYNRIKDKIVAYPKGQQFRWTMLNLGLVHIKGLDLSASATMVPLRDLFFTLRAQYTFQRAIDVTDPADSYYRNQIPYIPRHSGSITASAAWRSWCLNYSWIYVGERYSQQENIIYNYVQPWYTSDISISKDFTFSGTSLRAMLEVNNLLSQDYDVILNYPMPGRNFRFTLTVEI